LIFTSRFVKRNHLLIHFDKYWHHFFRIAILHFAIYEMFLVGEWEVNACFMMPSCHHLIDLY